MRSLRAVEQSFASRGARGLRRGWSAVVAVIVLGGVACSEGGTAPPEPGSIELTVETTGFFKDGGYELLLNGASQGAVGANDQMTIPDLESGTYEVDLGDVAQNCTVDAASVDLGEGEVVQVTLSVSCSFDTPTPYTIRANRDRPDLETGTIVGCSFGFCPSDDEWDIYAFFDTQSSPQAVIRQNQTINVEIAHLPGVALAELTEAHVEAATFTTDLVAEPFDAGRVILIRTDTGNVYALANPTEDTTALTLTLDVALLAEGAAP